MFSKRKNQIGILAMEGVLLCTQMFNITAKNTNAKASIQNDQENNTEVTNRNMQDRP